MARDGSGNYSLPVNSWNPATNGSPATAADWQSIINDVATAITQSVSKDGQTPMTGNLAMGGNKVTGLAAGTATTDAVTKDQLNTLDSTGVTAFAKTLLDDADAAAARATLDVPSRTGGNATGTWGISISGSASNADQLDGIDSSGFTRTTGTSSLGSFAQTSGNYSGDLSGVVEATNSASGINTATAFDARLHGVLVGGVHFTDTGDGGCEVSLDYTPPGSTSTDRRVFGGLRLRTDGVVEAKGFFPNGGVGAIGTYALLQLVPNATVSEGSLINGSDLRYAAASGLAGPAPAGTWRCMGRTVSGGTITDRTTLWLRIS